MLVDRNAVVITNEYIGIVTTAVIVKYRTNSKWQVRILKITSGKFYLLC